MHPDISGSPWCHFHTTVRAACLGQSSVWSRTAKPVQINLPWKVFLHQNLQNITELCSSWLENRSTVEKKELNVLPLIAFSRIRSCTAPAEQSSAIRLFLSAPPFPLLPLLRDTDSSTLACEVRDVDWNLWKRNELKAYFCVNVPALQMLAGRWLWLYLGLRKKGGGGEIAVFNLAIPRTH